MRTSEYEVMDARLSGLHTVVEEGFVRLQVAFPEQEYEAYTILLGKYYARQDNGVLMLGLNPGRSPEQRRDATRQTANWLLDGREGAKFRYWTNAARLFRSTDELQTAMQDATYAFCCPYRTVKWSGLPKSKLQALKRESAEPLARMMGDCRPRIVILAGLASFQVFVEILGAQLDACEALTPRGGLGGGTYQWQAWRAAFDKRPFVIAQIPHLSRASSKIRLAECGRWLTELVRGEIPLKLG